MKRYVIKFILICFLTGLAACGGGGSDDSISLSASESESVPTEDFTPTASESLDEIAINMFTDNGVNITTDPTTIDFNSEQDEIEKDDSVQVKFAIANNSGATRLFKFQIYAVSSGFSILDENGDNFGTWNDISIASGETKTFYAKFSAYNFGTQTSYITISADIDGFIRLPMRAVVSGAADFKILSTGSLCGDKTAEEIEELDFKKVPSGESEILSIKLCNAGGEDIKVTSAKIIAGDDSLESDALDDNENQSFSGIISDSIDAEFALGELPITSGSFTTPSSLDYPEAVTNADQSFGVSVQHSGEAVEDLLIAAGGLSIFDVTFAPTLSQSAPAGYRYNPVALNATLKLDTSLGEVEIPLLGASAGPEPILKMSYKLDDSEVWHDIDLSADNPAVYFEDVSLFLDWVSINSKTATIKIENTGTESLDFYGGEISGFYEYYWDDDATSLTFPITVEAGAAESFTIRYLPAATAALESGFETNYNFGIFEFEHTGGNGPKNQVWLVGEQKAGYAVELLYGESELEHTYADKQYKNLCAFTIDEDNPTTRTFKVINNNKFDSMTVSWTATATQDGSGSTGFDIVNNTASGSVTVTADSSQDIAIQFVGNEESIGSTVSGQLIVETEFVETESDYADAITDPSLRTFVVPFQATVNETGESSLCSGKILGVISDTEDTSDVTMIVNMVAMAMPPGLKEATRNYPAFKFHLPLELDKDNQRVRFASKGRIAPVYDNTDPDFNRQRQLFTPLHQASNNNGCATLPSNPYKQEFERGSWTGPGYDKCAIEYTDPKNGKKHSVYGDTTCMEDNLAEEYTDTDGVKWNVMYHDFVKFDTVSCEVEYYGKVATFAWRPGQETEIDVLELAEESPDEDEAFYESIFRSFQFDSYIEIPSSTHTSYCGGSSLVTDADSVKDCYKSLTALDPAIRTYGHVDECAHFYYIFEEGKVPDDAYETDPDFDNWSGYGVYEPHYDAETKEYSSTKYDITIYNIDMHAFMIRAGDRSSFFGHASHLLHSHMGITLTTKRVAEEEWAGTDDWQQRIAVTTRPHVDKGFVFIEDGANSIDIENYWTADGKSSELGNVIDGRDLDPGVDYGGTGKGTFRYQTGSQNKIILAGWPLNYDQNNLVTMIGIGVFAGPGETAPSFAKADSATGKGKVMSFGLFGCIVEGDPNPNQGCFDYKLDDTVMPDSGRSVIDEYVDFGMLPSGYPTNEDCAKLSDAGFFTTEEYTADPYKYMACVNYRIDDVDRDRLKNYYESNKFTFIEDPYKSSQCGYGM